MSQILRPQDLDQLAREGRSAAEVERQLSLFASPPRPALLDRPCRVGDGVLRIAPDNHAGLEARWQHAAGAGRLTRFVPASGAASRMFQPLVPHSQGAAPDLASEKAGSPLATFAAGLADFAFAPALAQAVKARGGTWEAPATSGKAAQAALQALFARDGLDYLDKPKAMLLFHAGGRTAFADQLHEAQALGVKLVHFTITAAHRPLFEAALAAAHTSLTVTFSEQSPATDTIAADLDNQPFRNADGSLLFRPGGHGALLHNLNALGGDIVFIKNIDNILPAARQPLVIQWKKLLAGVLLELEHDVHDLLRRLRGDDDPAVGEALDLCKERLGLAPPEAIASRADDRLRHWVIDRLDRPLRVCGVVPTRGEPGGGRFWVRDREGHVSRQIVEQAEMDLSQPEQKQAFAAATHFNPVDLVCSLRDEQGRPYDLARFVDPEAVFLARKSQGGRELKALELPGLWNGGMARWNTLFVEVPGETFAPVKTVLDLLRPEHRG